MAGQTLATEVSVQRKREAARPRRLPRRQPEGSPRRTRHGPHSTRQQHRPQRPQKGTKGSPHGSGGRRHLRVPRPGMAHAGQTRVWSDIHATNVMARLERDVFPWLGNTPIRELTVPEMLRVLRRIEERVANETAHRVQGNCAQVFCYAIASWPTATSCST